MQDRSECPAQQVSEKDRTLSGLLRQARIFEALDAQLQGHLSSGLRGQLRVACVRDRTLVLAANTPAWASRARLESAQILEAMRPLWPGELSSCQVVVAPSTAER